MTLLVDPGGRCTCRVADLAAQTNWPEFHFTDCPTFKETHMTDTTHKTITVTLDDETHQSFAAVAAHHERSISGHLRWLARQAVIERKRWSEVDDRVKCVEPPPPPTWATDTAQGLMDGDDF